MAARRLAGDLRLSSIGWSRKWAKSSCFDLRRVERVLRIDQLQLVARALHQRGAGLGAHADPVDRARHGQRAVGLDGDLEARSVQRTRSAARRLAASARRRSAPRKAACRNCRATFRGRRRRGFPAWRICRRLARRCRRNRCRRNCRWRRRGPLRGPTTDCSRRSGRTRRRARSAPLRLAACSRFP